MSVVLRELRCCCCCCRSHDDACTQQGPAGPPSSAHSCANGPSPRRRYIFLEYASPAHAADAVKNADGYKLDKQHTFRVNLFTDFDKCVEAWP